MTKKKKTRILDPAGVRRTISRIAHEIVVRTRGVEDLALIGIRTRGAFIADRIADVIKREEGARPQVGILDITLYRDDFSTVSEQPIVRATEIDFDVNDKVLVLVDDVLYTGRTVRAALDAIVDFGRPKRVELAVLIDRCHRELPIRADYAGTELSIKYEDLVHVKIKEVDGVDEVVIEERNGVE